MRGKRQGKKKAKLVGKGIEEKFLMKKDRFGGLLEIFSAHTRMHVYI